MHFLLKVLVLFKIKSKLAKRKDIEKQILQKTNTINNNNWRNAFISLASLGFINNSNYPTQIGIQFANMPFNEFAFMVFDSYIKPYFELILDVLQKDSNLNNQEICKKIKQNLKTENDILFLTESNGRYLSSWLNIARDDFKIIDFSPRNSKRDILFNPFTSNKRSFMEHIRQNSNFLKYKEKFNKVLDEI